MAHTGDTEDLEALFDQISSETLARLDAEPAADAAPAAAAAVSEDEAAADQSPEFYQRVGMLTRQLHDALRELGYHQKVEQAVHSLPDTRQRLDYIARLTGQAAERALSNVEKGQEIQEGVEKEGARLSGQWRELYGRRLGVDDFKRVAAETSAFLDRTQDDARATQALLTDIMMAQDFHDLTGQVIQKVLKLAQNFEDELVKLLIESTPPEKRNAAHSEWMNGPVIDASSRDDVVANQAQVDDLLESLGF
ncbi:protein phosphatase CheZ [Pigmentiphaga sp.]|uniref:protein phosphatase CheZ n=1 Tax=Pigmentiphaga sp. TaxID=1977564 RepID=UPI00128AE3FA|nr:protein phosphatase CheZ [Pigmentiphaga sp.]MPS30397.1 protein phosphatase CheZ [Alcaligenaceae bacterium SAGV5]MPS50364.1 protein phosphatase CheZ [Alcaligenaceae bacterium SAGV3]MPT57470.1 protein phosphatase CheZ [Alcaligenaceae bacterium]